MFILHLYSLKIWGNLLDVICIIRIPRCLTIDQVPAELDAMQALNNTMNSLGEVWIYTAQKQLAAVTFQFAGSSHCKAAEHTGEQCFDSWAPCKHFLCPGICITSMSVLHCLPFRHRAVKKMVCGKWVSSLWAFHKLRLQPMFVMVQSLPHTYQIQGWTSS